MIIITANVKGGTGKSLISLFTANHLAYNLKRKVLLIDSDPQGTLLGIKAEQHRNNVDVSNAYALEPFVNNSPAKWKQYLEIQTKQGYDTIIIDTGGNLGGAERAYLFGIADTIILPLIAHRTVLETSINFIRDLLALVEGNKVNLLAISNFEKRTKEAAEMEIIEQLGSVKLIGSLKDRIRYARHRDYTQAIDDDDVLKLMKALTKHF